MKNFDEKNINIKKDIKSLTVFDEIRISNGFRTSYLSLSDNPDNLAEIPITALRIIFKIISDLRFSQYQTPKDFQYSMFDEDFKSSNNSYAQFTFKTTDIIGHTKNKEAVKRALAFLTDYKKGWYISKNSKGKEVETFGGLILSPSTLSGNISFLVSSYWMEKIVDVKNYNDSLYQIVFKLKSSKQVLFYLWILCIKAEGTRVNFKTINDRFKLSYKDAKSIGKEFLKPMKIQFDLYSGVGFNYSIQGDLIHFLTYNNVHKENQLGEATFSKIKIKAKVQYWKRRHSLSIKESEGIKKVIENNEMNFELLISAYNHFILNCKKMKLVPTDLKKENFIIEFQKYIDRAFKESERSRTEKISPKL